jgi:hypothetical protein
MNHSYGDSPPDRKMNFSLIEMSRDPHVKVEDYREHVMKHICVNGFGEEIYNDHFVRASLYDFIKELDVKLLNQAKRDMSLKVTMRF